MSALLLLFFDFLELVAHGETPFGGLILVVKLF